MACLRARRPKEPKLVANPRLREYVVDRIGGLVEDPAGEKIAGPEARFTGRGRDRRWAKAQSPAQVANRIRLDFPDDETMRISHEAIYQALYKGEGLDRELSACLRQGRALRRAQGPGASRAEEARHRPDLPTAPGSRRPGRSRPPGKAT